MSELNMATITTRLRKETETLADLLEWLGGIPPERVWMHPFPGTATEEDLIAILDGPNKRICELVDGVLVEKPMGFKEGLLGSVIGHLIWAFLDRHNLGVAAGADGPVRLRLGLVRVPDVCFVSWKRIGGDEVPDGPISAIIPELAIEVLSKGNTPCEIALKLQEYFRAGVLVVWVINPKTQTAEVYTSPTRKRQIGKDGALDGGAILPGFKLSLKDLFARAKRRQGRK